MALRGATETSWRKKKTKLTNLSVRLYVRGRHFIIFFWVYGLECWIEKFGSVLFEKSFIISLWFKKNFEIKKRICSDFMKGCYVEKKKKNFFFFFFLRIIDDLCRYSTSAANGAIIKSCRQLTLVTCAYGISQRAVLVFLGNYPEGPANELTQL